MTSTTPEVFLYQLLKTLISLNILNSLGVSRGRSPEIMGSKLLTESLTLLEGLSGPLAGDSDGTGRWVGRGGRRVSMRPFSLPSGPSRSSS